jgi:hypothetical protein
LTPDDLREIGSINADGRANQAVGGQLLLAVAVSVEFTTGPIAQLLGPSPPSERNAPSQHVGQRHPAVEGSLFDLFQQTVRRSRQSPWPLHVSSREWPVAVSLCWRAAGAAGCKGVGELLVCGLGGSARSAPRSPSGTPLCRCWTRLGRGRWPIPVGEPLR